MQDHRGCPIIFTDPNCFYVKLLTEQGDQLVYVYDHYDDKASVYHEGDAWKPLTVVEICNGERVCLIDASDDGEVEPLSRAERLAQQVHEDVQAMFGTTATDEEKNILALGHAYDKIVKYIKPLHDLAKQNRLAHREGLRQFAPDYTERKYTPRTVPLYQGTQPQD